MAQHLLIVQIDRDGRDELMASHKRVTFVRSFKHPTKYSVVCAAFDVSFVEDNKIVFSPEWEVYFSLKSIAGFKKVDMQVEYDVSIGYTYIFNGNLSGLGEAPDPGMYGFKNQYNQIDPLTVGLAQKISVPGGDGEFRPVNAAAVQYNDTIYFEPVDKIKVFAATNMVEGDIILSSFLEPISGPSQVEVPFTIGPFLEVTMEGNETYIHYDNINNIFAQGKLKS